ncbi:MULTISPECIES: extracellular solute-binding protein [unclassified Butyrivibrio]|uniref:extracellular solute-binding protein n=1 Tax=unclassified Butyrivibrio TaxID=2639466 RepID=UPI0003B5FEC6|nr:MULTISPECIES: extracellular solute-binding protein [unclassified Butyrivibrio]SDB47552.1 iron(III) transport system substrate-binding protein [Butyrivibrio sp. INlla16]
MKQREGLPIWAIIAVLLVVALLGGILLNLNKKNTESSDKLVVVSPHPTDFMIPLIQEFENETGIEVDLRSCGTSEAIRSMVDDENIDVLWGGSLLSVGAYSEFFYPYKTVNRAMFKDDFKDIDGRITCFSNVPSVIIVNEDIIGNTQIEGYEDLLAENLKGKIAYANPGKSSSAFEHLVNILYAMGDGNPEAGWDYVEKFIDQLNGILLGSSSEVYEGVAAGKYVAGLTFEEAAVTMLGKGKHIRIIYMEEGVVSTPDGIYISKDSAHILKAEKFVDFMTSAGTQEFMAGNLGRRSVRRDVSASELVIPDNEITAIDVDRDEVISKKDEWNSKFLALFGEDSDE